MGSHLTGHVGWAGSHLTGQVGWAGSQLTREAGWAGWPTGSTAQGLLVWTGPLWPTGSTTARRLLVWTGPLGPTGSTGPFLWTGPAGSSGPRTSGLTEVGRRAGWTHCAGWEVLENSGLQEAHGAGARWEALGSARTGPATQSPWSQV